MTVKISGNSSVSTPSFAGDDGDSGLHATADQVQLVTNGTVGVTVDSSQRIGINTTDPNANSGSGAQNLVIGTAASSVAGMTINTGTGSYQGRINFGRGTTNQDYGYLLCDHSNGFMSFGVASTERLKITDNGTIQLKNSPGIDFSQIQTNVGGMTSETLDSYEEGTCTIGITNTNSAPTFNTAPTNTTGYYVKVGNLCTVSYYSDIFNVSSNGSGSAILTGLPFLCANLPSHYATGSITHCTCYTTDVENGYVGPNTTYLVPVQENSTNGMAHQTSVNVFIMFSVTYRTA